MKLKTSPTFVIEFGQHVENSLNICLLGTERACSLFPELKNLTSIISSATNSFASVFGYDYKFYYKLNKISNGNLLDTEIGIGYLIEDNGSVFLKRDKPILYQHDNGQFCQINNPVHAFTCHQDEEYLIVQAYHPNTIPELLIDPNSLIVSSEDNPLNILNIEENSVVGRLDGNTTSISIFDLLLKITEYTKQIILSCSQLDVKKLKTKILQLIPLKTPQAKKGSIIYNEEHDTIEYFDGSRWRTLLWRFTDE